MPSYTHRMNAFPPVGAHLIAGDWVTDGAAGTGVSLNPARPDEPVGDYPIGDAGTASDAVGAAVEARSSWRSLPFGARARILEQAAREQGDTALEFFTRTRTAYIRPDTRR